MKKEIVRKEFFKLRLKQQSYSRCQKILKDEHSYSVSIRTLKRWQQRLECQDWDLKDNSRRPKIIHYKVKSDQKEEILSLRKLTGWGALRLQQSLAHIDLSHDTINIILREQGLTRKDGNRGQRVKYVRFQRRHANSLWHIDDSEFGKSGKIIAVIDDCSRYCLGILHTNTVTTKLATNYLEQLIKIYGKPRQIISDNGSPYGSKSKHSKFDRWCRKNGIEHIRTRVKRPQTNGKVERIFQTIGKEISFCKGDTELFRYRYNHFRPHQSLKWKTPSQIFNDFERNLDW